MSKNVQKSPKMSKNAKCPKMSKKDQKCPKKTKNVHKMSKRVQKRPKMSTPSLGVPLQGGGHSILTYRWYVYIQKFMYQIKMLDVVDVVYEWYIQVLLQCPKEYLTQVLHYSAHILSKYGQGEHQVCYCWYPSYQSWFPSKNPFVIYHDI